jgi:hypothetical protein
MSEQFVAAGTEFLKFGYLQTICDYFIIDGFCYIFKLVNSNNWRNYNIDIFEIGFTNGTKNRPGPVLGRGGRAYYKIGIWPSWKS